MSKPTVAAIGITNQRETAILGSKNGRADLQRHRLAGPAHGRPFAIVCASKARGSHREKTGLVIDAYFSASKICWMLDNVPDARKRAERGELAFGTVDSWLIWKLPAERGTSRT